MPLVDRKYEDRLKDYTDVKQRITLFYEKYPDGRLVTDRVEMWYDIEPPRVFVWAKAYRTPDDPLPGDGVSWLELPGRTNFTRGSEVENAQTSAWGRAIGALGIGITAGIASVDEIEGKKDDGKPAAEVAAEELDQPTDGSLIGTVTEGKPPTDLQLRYEPDGTAYAGFALTQGRKRLQVVAVGPLAEALQPFLAGLVGQRVTCYGTVEMIGWMKDGRKMPEYPRLQLERIVTDDWTLPAPEPIAVGQVGAFDIITEEEAREIIAREKEEAAL